MFLKLVGLSLIVHVTIIGSAKIINFFRGEKHGSAFQTYGKNGGVVRSEMANRVIALSIVTLVVGYSSFLFYMGVRTSLEVGATEPQVIFMKSVFASAFAFLTAFFLSVEGVMVVASALLAWIGFRFVTRRQTAITVPESLPGVVRRRWVPALSVAAVFAFMIRLGLGAMIGAALFSVPLWAGAQIVEPGFQSEVVAGGFTLPTATAYTPDGRIFVAEKNGVVKVIKNGNVLSTPLITLTDINTFGDRGLIGMAVDPNFDQNGYLYLSYTYENTPGLNVAGSKTARIVRVTVVGDTASESTKLVLVGTIGGNAAQPSCEDFAITDDCIPSDSNSHSAGALAFGPDGKLYASTGDGADFNAVDSRALRAQDIDSLGGKVLRINTDGTGPSDNPFFNGDPNSNRSKVFALGFRNQFRLHFHPVTGQLYGGDVGWSLWEEVNAVDAGNNYGWPCREGNIAQPQYACTASSPTTDPLYTYAHDSNGAGSITLGAFPSNNAYPAQYDNTLFIGDYAQQWIKQLNLDAAGNFVSVTDFEKGGIFPVELQRGTDGNVYYIDIAYGTLNRLTHTTGNRAPVITQSADVTSGLTPLTVAFSSAGTFDPDGDAIGYAWNFGDGTFAATANPSHTYTQAGAYDVTLVVSDVHGASAAKTMTIIAGNQKPAASILSPANGSFYRALDQVTVTGDASDLEDGTLPASAFDWQVILHHNVHTHPVQQFSNTKSITFTADDHNDPDVYMEVILTVTDSAGLSDTKSINMYYNNAPTGLSNLVSNPSVETPDPAISYQPKDWYNGWFGQMNTTFTYPAIGIDGQRAIQVDVSGYVSGTSKWFFSPVFIEGGKTYTFSDAYRATTQSDVVARFERADGSTIFQYIDTLAATPDAVVVSYDITAPIDAVNMTIYHELSSNGQLTTDAFSLIEKVATSTDTNPPTATITNISDNQVISGTTTIQISAQDAEGPITKVHLYVDGSKFGALEDTTAPFSLDWDTTQVADGSHTIQAHVHDVADNHGLSAPITVVVDNSSTTTPPARTNLIQNGGFEVAGPANWTAGGWGANTRVHTIEAGRTGGNAAKVAITVYPVGDIGDAKWVHDVVPVTPGQSYTFETYYKSDTISDIIGRYTYADGSVSYFGIIKEIPPNANWTYLTDTFVPPPNAVNVTFFHLISSVGYVTIDDVAIYDNNATSTPSEANAPLVSWLNPTEGATVGGVVTFQTDATDDTAVAGVYYAIDGVPFGAEQYVYPYSLQWDTTTYPDGDYLIKTTAHDPYGNNDKDEITITVDNSGTPPPPATSTNRIVNGEMEIANGADPQGWSRGGWGTNTRLFTYPVTGNNGNGARVEITSYTSGDAKWYFADVAVTGGETVPYTESYRSNAPSGLTARFTDAAGAVSYQYLATLPAAAAWTPVSRDIVVPASAVSMTMFHTISSVGYLETDSFTLGGGNGTSTPPTPDTTAPTVSQSSLTNGQTVSGVINIDASATDNVAIGRVELLEDGGIIAADTTEPYVLIWDTTGSANGTTTLYVRASDTSNNQTTTSAITVFVNNGGTPPPPATSTNRVVNGELETANGLDPLGFSRGGWGINTRTFTYPVTGNNGNGARVEITSYTSGDAKWYFADVPVTGGETVPFTHAYRSNISTEVLARFTNGAGTASYQYLGGLPAATTWTSSSFDITVPAGAVSMTIFHVMAGVGYLETDSFTLGGTGTGTTTPPTPDITEPTVSQTSLSNGQTVSGVETINVTATDDVAVANVQLLINGAVADTDTTAPYSFAWDTTALANGNVNVAVRATDTSNNSDETPTVTVNVDNTVTPPPPSGNNLVSNGDFETLDVNNQPVGWRQGGYGTNDSVYTIATSSLYGNVAYVEISNYVSGDAKWVFDDVAVTPGATYRYGLDYASKNNNEVVAYYGLSDGTFRAELLEYAPAYDTSSPDDLRGYAVDFTIPVDAVTVSVFFTPLVIDVTEASYAYIDDVHLSQITPPTGGGGTPGSGGLITNGHLELADPTDASRPDSWAISNFGQYDSTFTYPVSGRSGNAARIAVTNYVSGDAKWTFDPVAVTPGELYTFTYTYRSDVETDLTAQFERADGTFFYVGIAKQLPSTVWLNPITEAIVVPDDAVAMSVFHSLTSNGFLEIDEISLVQGTPYAFNNGKISLTFDDGWLSQYAEALPRLEAVDLDATFYITTDYTLGASSVELVQNNEITSGGTTPTNWLQGGWGTNDRTYSFDGTSVTVNVANYVNGDAKWYFTDVPVTAGNSYVIGDTYRSNTPSELLVRYTRGDGTVQYGSIATLPSTNNVNKVFNATVIAPANTVSMTVFHVLAGNGSLTIERASVVQAGSYMSADLVQRLQSAGHEIGAHTKTHPALSTLSQPEQVDEIEGSKSALENVIVPGSTITNMAYPFGDYGGFVTTNVMIAGYDAARSVNRGYNTTDTFPFALKIQSVNRTATIADVNRWIAQAEQDNTWLILMFHQIDTIPANDHGTTPAILDQILTAVKNSSLDVETVGEVIPLLN